jgi:hypothetical protein
MSRRVHNQRPLWKCILYAYRTSRLHVLIGTIFWHFVLYRLNKGELRPDHHVGFELASLYSIGLILFGLYLLLCTTGIIKQIQS